MKTRTFFNLSPISRKVAKHLKMHNSRTNLINDKDVYVEDVEEEIEEEDEYDRVDGEKRNIRYHHIHHHHHGPDGRRSQMAAMPIDDDSMRRHEMDRGSDIGYERRGSLKRQQAAAQDDEAMVGRDQLFIKDGNAEILRLITRGKKDEDNIYVNVPQLHPQPMPQHQQQQQQAVPQYIMVDNGGKEILMRRYIEEQSNGKHVIREHYQVVPGPTYIQSMPNEVQTQQEAYVQKASQPGSQIAGGVQFPEQNIPVDAQMMNAHSHHSLIQQELENSLKQQNALLRQILLEKEKLEEQRFQQNAEQMAMETQSLPPPISSFAIATQTDCDAGTQTEAPMETSAKQQSRRRRARSENDDSGSEEDFEYVRYSPPNSPKGVYWIKRRKSRSRKGKHQEKPRRMVMVEAVKRKIRTPIQEECEDPRGATPGKERQRGQGKSRARSESPLNKKILVEISDSLDEQIIPNIQNKKKYFSRTYLSAEPGQSAASKRFSRTRNEEEEEEESSGNEIIVKHYSADSLDDRSDVEEDQIRVTKRAEPKKKIYSREESAVDPNEALQQISDIIAKSRPNSRIDNIESPAHVDEGRKSRRDDYEPSPRSRRQTASEPPQSRASKGPAPKGPDSDKARRVGPKEKTHSESELLKRVQEEGERETKTVPKYMEWYYNKNNAGDSSRADKMRAKAAAAAAASAASSKKSTAQGDSKRSKKPSPMSQRKTQDERNYKPEPLPRRTTPPKEARMLKEDIMMAKNIDQKKKNQPTDDSHSLLQHSEHRFEAEYKKAPALPPPPSKLPHYMYPETPPHVNRETKVNVQQLKAAQSPIKEDEEKHSKSKVSYSTGSLEQKQLNASTLEDDHDSGIAMNSLLHSMGRRNPIVDKKSIFTIAYDESKVSKIRSESDGSPLV